MRIYGTLFDSSDRTTRIIWRDDNDSPTDWCVETTIPPFQDAFETAALVCEGLNSVSEKNEQKNQFT
jgi:hypothetical protein